MNMTRPQNTDLFAWADRAGTFILANLLWVLLSLPIITLPLAMVGLFATLAPWGRGKPSEVFRDFFGGVREHWRSAMVIGAINLLVGGLVALNLSIFRLMNMSQPVALLSQSITFFVALVLITVNLYIWPLLVTFDIPLRELLSIALKLVFVHPFASMGILLATVAILLGSTVLPAMFLLLGSVSACALTICWGVWRVVRGHIAEDERMRLES
ncbi:MAG: DUF624 domain-containing protein [Anaerolineaceae bacterium]|nr:DUF624 domain-containing protein [Anaerolineaceae bacterium]